MGSLFLHKREEVQAMVVMLIITISLIALIVRQRMWLLNQADLLHLGLLSLLLVEFQKCS